MKKLWWLAILPIFAAGAALADYAVTQGSGTNFASNLVSTVHYMANMLCDATAGKTQCAAVNASGQVGVTGPVTVTNTPNVTISGTPNVAVASSVPEGALGAAAGCTPGASNTMVQCLYQLHTDMTTAVPTGGNVIGFTSNDPCSQATKLGAGINLTASGQVITGTASTKTYICAVNLVSATAQNIALVEGTGTTCATNVFGLSGGTTAATGWNLAANSGLALGGGSGTVISPSADANGTAANVCLLLSSTGQTSGQIAYVQQ